MRTIIYAATLIAALTACAQAGETTIASQYDRSSGAKTANGSHLNEGSLTAAHRTWPFGTKVRVTNLRNGHSAIVTINDRGPFVHNRGIDLTPAGARALAFNGLAKVKMERLN